MKKCVYLVDGKFCIALVCKHGVHCKREGYEDDAVDCEEVDEVPEKHLLNHDGKATRDSTSSC